MRRFILFIFFFLLMNFSVFSQDFPDKEAILVKTFPVGINPGELGFEKVEFASASPSPTAFCFDSNGLLYICDTINKRICIFDESFNYIKSIENSPIIEPGLLEVDNEGNLIGSYGIYGIQKMDDSGKGLIRIFLYGEDIVDEVRNDGFYIANNMVLAYKDDGGIIGFNNPGTDYKANNRHILNTQEVIREIERNHPSLRVETGIEPSVQQRSSTSGPIAPSRQKEEYVIYENGITLSRDFNRLMALKSQDGTLQSKSLAGDSQYSLLLEKYSHHRFGQTFIGNDNDGNSYWLIHLGIFVFNPQL